MTKNSGLRGEGIASYVVLNLTYCDLNSVRCLF